jgi:hypothetical protein
MSYAGTVKRAELGLEGTQYSADKKFKSSIISEANRARIAREDRSSRERVAKADRRLKAEQFSADLELRQFIADSEASAREVHKFADAAKAVKDTTGAMKDIFSSAISIASLFV